MKPVQPAMLHVIHARTSHNVSLAEPALYKSETPVFYVPALPSVSTIRPQSNVKPATINADNA